MQLNQYPWRVGWESGHFTSRRSEQMHEKPVYSTPTHQLESIDLRLLLVEVVHFSPDRFIES